MAKEVDVVDKSVSSRRSPHHHRPPVAVVFEIDDYTSDSGALGEDSLLDFVRDFTEEMKDNSADGTGTRHSADRLPSLHVILEGGAYASRSPRSTW